MSLPTLLIRPSVSTDLCAMRDVHAHAVVHGQLLAAIGDSNNPGSFGVHRALGVKRIGPLQTVGRKLGPWRDTVLMQLALNNGARDDPTGCAS